MESSALALICRCKLCVRTFISKFSSLKSGDDEIVRGVQKKKKRSGLKKEGIICWSISGIAAYICQHSSPSVKKINKVSDISVVQLNRRTLGDQRSFQPEQVSNIPSTMQICMWHQDPRNHVLSVNPLNVLHSDLTVCVCGVLITLIINKYEPFSYTVQTGAVHFRCTG